MGDRKASLSSASGHPGGSGLVCVAALWSAASLFSKGRVPSYPCEHEVYQEIKIVGLAEPLTQPHTGHTGFGSLALVLPGPSGATCLVSDVGKK